MELDAALLFLPINMKNFPAKLWRLVNDPHTDSVRWDQQGEGILIDRALFEAEVLSAVREPAADGGNAASGDLFKTNNFTSFIRQLNLYGFRKGGGRQDDEPDSPAELHFQNPYFKRDKPELLAHLRRMTRSNRAKLQAGLEVSCRRPSRWQLQFSAPPCRGHAGHRLAGHIHDGSHGSMLSPDQCHSEQEMRGYDRTVMPQCSWIVEPSDTSAPCTVSPTLGAQQLPSDSPHLGYRQKHRIAPHHLQYPPGFYASAMCQCCFQPVVNARRVHQTSSAFSHYSYNQTNYPGSWVHPENQEWPSSDSELAKKEDVNLDTVFQIADNLQVSPIVCMAKVQATEMPVSFFDLSPSSSGQLNSTEPAGSNALPILMDSMKASPRGLVPAGGMSVAVLNDISPDGAFAIIHPDSLQQANYSGNQDRTSNDSPALDFSRKVPSNTRDPLTFLGETLQANVTLS
ncbi:heat shock factor protein 5 isoform X2 [Scleropages formosus]|nr:heat shock factor protein 5 isoform X2 [Scleropages formosus]